MTTVWWFIASGLLIVGAAVWRWMVASDSSTIGRFRSKMYAKSPLVFRSTREREEREAARKRQDEVEYNIRERLFHFSVTAGVDRGAELALLEEIKAAIVGVGVDASASLHTAHNEMVVCIRRTPSEWDRYNQDPTTYTQLTLSELGELAQGTRHRLKSICLANFKLHYDPRNNKSVTLCPS